MPTQSFCNLQIIKLQLIAIYFFLIIAKNCNCVNHNCNFHFLSLFYLHPQLPPQLPQSPPQAGCSPRLCALTSEWTIAPTIAARIRTTIAVPISYPPYIDDSLTWQARAGYTAPSEGGPTPAGYD